MAKIIVENAMVRRVFSTQHGWGVSVFETFTRHDKSEGRSYFTLWFKEHPGVEEGQQISASGFHSVRVREYEDAEGVRHSADVSVNSARLIAGSPAAPGPDADVWDVPGEQF